MSGLAVVLAGLNPLSISATRVDSGEIFYSGQALSGFQTSLPSEGLLTTPVSFRARPAPQKKPGRAQVLSAAVPVQPRIRRVFLGIGDGIYNTADPRWIAVGGRKPVASPGAGLELQRLPGTSAAIDACARAAHASRVLVLRGRDCSRSRLQEALRAKPNIIYIGTHIVSDRGQRAIELGIDGDGRRELLTSADIRRFHVPGAIVTMAGCGSAADAGALGGGLVGAWLAAGARAVIGARFSIPDGRGQFTAVLYADLLRDSAPGAIARVLRNASVDAAHAGPAPDYSAAWVAVVKEH